MGFAPHLWRLIDSGTVSPEFSTAADEAVLNARLRELVPNTMHFYVRECPTISVGYNQSVKESIALDEVGRRGVRIIRRFSGGSAVYTDRGQLIYALVVDSSFLSDDIIKSYEKICSAVIRGLSALGVRAEYRPVNDIEVNGLKISGSAQLRRGGIVLHHGTVMIDTDLECLAAVLRPTKKKRNDPMCLRRVTCLRDVLGRTPELQEVKRALVEGIREIFDVTLEPYGLTPPELADVERLIREKYGTQGWNWRL